MVKNKFASIDRLYARCPAMKFYLRDFREMEHGSPEAEAYRTNDDPWPAMQKWIGGSPRPVQRAEALLYSNRTDNRILAGKLSGTGKTTVAWEYIWTRTVNADGTALDTTKRRNTYRFH
jgi:hypothetical protein